MKQSFIDYTTEAGYWTEQLIFYRNSITHNLFLCISIGTEQVYSFHVTKVNVMPQEKDEKQFADIFLLTVTIQSLVT